MRGSPSIQDKIDSEVKTKLHHRQLWRIWDGLEVRDLHKAWAIALYDEQEVYMGLLTSELDVDSTLDRLRLF